MVVLGIDQAATSGWCIARRIERDGRVREPEIVSHGVVRTATERREVIARAIDVAGLGPLCAVYEQHTVGGGPRWNPITIMGIGAARGRWLEALELAGVARRRCIGVEPATWRGAMIGRHRLTGDEWKRQALLSCRGRGVSVESDDEAEAVLIAMWGARHSAEVAAETRRAA